MGVSYAQAYASRTSGDGRLYRMYCLEQGMKRCEHCGEYRRPADLVEVVGDRVCREECADERLNDLRAQYRMPSATAEQVAERLAEIDCDRRAERALQ